LSFVWFSLPFPLLLSFPKRELIFFLLITTSSDPISFFIYFFFCFRRKKHFIVRPPLLYIPLPACLFTFPFPKPTFFLFRGRDSFTYDLSYLAPSSVDFLFLFPPPPHFGKCCLCFVASAGRVSLSFFPRLSSSPQTLAFVKDRSPHFSLFSVRMDAPFLVPRVRPCFFFPHFYDFGFLPSPFDTYQPCFPPFPTHPCPANLLKNPSSPKALINGHLCLQPWNLCCIPISPPI